LPFSVVEEKVDEAGQPYIRRRPIAWPKSANERLKVSGYEPQVDLRYFAHYRAAALHEAATLRDLKAGFFEVEIPHYARSQFRFRDAEGRLYEMCRLPMGHSASPEIMQTLTSVLAGDPAFCAEQESFTFSSPGSLAVWIDGIRYTGSAADMQQAGDFVDQRAKRFGMTCKPSESRTAVQDYEFIGVRWDHRDHSIGLATKNLKKLDVNILSLSVDELEQFSSRLIWASQVHAVPFSSVCRETPRSACMPMLIPKTNRRNMAQLCLKGTGSPKIISVFPSANEEPQGVGRNTPAFPRKGRPHKAPLTHPRVQKRNCHAGIIARCEYGAFPNDTIPAFSLSLTPCESKTRRC
jgi:hypothetical protein